MQNERFASGRWIPPWVRHEHLARFEFAAQYISGKTVVDCACGEGWGTEIFLKAGGTKIYAFDLSKQSVAEARRRGDPVGHPEKIHFQVADALALPLPNHSADIFISLETLEHIPADLLFLKEVCRVLKKDGLFICSTPNRKVTNPGLKGDQKPWNRFHVREYSPEEWTLLLNDFFGSVEMYGQNLQSPRRLKFLTAIGRKSLKTAVFLSQFVKSPLWICDAAEKHQVLPWRPGSDYEYMVSVCRNPRTGTK